MSVEDLARAVEQTVILVGQASKVIMFQRRHSVLSSLLRDPRKATSVLKEESELLATSGKKRKEKKLLFMIALSQQPLQSEGKTTLHKDIFLLLNYSFKPCPPNHKKIVSRNITGRIAFFVSNWSKLRNDKEILQMMKGLHLKFFWKPHQRNYLTEIIMSQKKYTLVQTKIKGLLRKGTTIQVQNQKVQFVSNIFLRPQKDGQFRQKNESKIC